MRTERSLFVVAGTYGMWGQSGKNKSWEPGRGRLNHGGKFGVHSRAFEGCRRG